jgi:hypothetical protein
MLTVEDKFNTLSLWNFSFKIIKGAMAPFALCAICIGSAAAQTTTTTPPPNPALHVEFNKIVDPTGAAVTLRGVSIIAPEQNAECHTCNSRPIPDLIAQLSGHQASDPNWAARVVRIPITTKYATDPATSFAKYIQPNVDAAEAKGLYAIIDLHYVSDYGGSRGISQAYLERFWGYVSNSKYKNDPNVLFEVFNEPINPDNWTTWKNYITPVVATIRNNGANNIILMGSPYWSERAYNAVTDPIPDSANNLVYVDHMYPNEGTDFETKFGAASRTIPIMVTEFGWDPTVKHGGTAGTTSGWGTTFRKYMDANPQISWTSWIFDDFWTPTFFDTKWNLLGGEHEGQFVKDWLWAQQDCGQPSEIPTPEVCHPFQ